MTPIHLRYTIQICATVYSLVTGLLIYTLDSSEGYKAIAYVVYSFYGLVILLAVLLLLGIVNFVQKRNELGKEFLMNILYSVANYIIVIAGIAAILS